MRQSSQVHSDRRHSRSEKETRINYAMTSLQPSFRYATSGLLFAALAFQTAARADHLPERLLAQGNPEISLAGINLKTTKLDGVIRKYGPPTRELRVPNNPTWTGYLWEFPHAKLEIGVNGVSSGTQIEDVYIEGTATGTLASTGRGLRLGDDIATLQRIYGNNFELSSRSADAPRTRTEFTGVTGAHHTATVQWRSDEFTLTVGFNDEGKVTAMWLILPECYPDGCD